MRLLIYSHFFRPSIGGVETVVESLAAGLASLRSPNNGPSFEVTVVTNTGIGKPDEPKAQYGVIRQPTSRQLRGLIKSSDVVHVAGVAIPPIIAALRTDRPIVVEHHGFQAICPTGQLLQEPQEIPCPGHFMNGNYGACLRCGISGSVVQPFRQWLLTFVRRSLCRRVDINIVPTAWLGEQLKLPRTKTVPHGLAWQPALVQIKREIPLIVFVGRLVTTKGVRLLLEACRNLKEKNCTFELAVIGTGPERQSLEEQAKDMRLTAQVRFLGQVPSEQISLYLGQAAAVVVPSLGGEVFGMVAAENMLRGLPVIASDIGALAEVVGNSGMIFKTGDAEDLARRLREVLGSPDRGRRVGEAGRQRILDSFSLERMIDEHADIYRRVARS